MTIARAVPDEALSALADGEPVLAFAWARVQRFGTSYSTFYPVGVVIGAVDLLRNRSRMKKLRAVTRSLGFPLDRSMAMVVTPDRLLIWSAHRHPRRVGEFLGEMPQARIATAKLPFSNSGPWKTVRLWLTDTSAFQFQIDASTAQAFVSNLDKTATN